MYGSYVRTEHTATADRQPYVRVVRMAGAEKALSCNAFLLYGLYVQLVRIGRRTYGPYVRAVKKEHTARTYG